MNQEKPKIFRCNNTFIQHIPEYSAVKALDLFEKKFERADTGKVEKPYLLRVSSLGFRKPSLAEFLESRIIVSLTREGSGTWRKTKRSFSPAVCTCTSPKLRTVGITPSTVAVTSWTREKSSSLIWRTNNPFCSMLTMRSLVMNQTSK